MSAHAGWDYVGAAEQSYPAAAARAVRQVHPQNPSPVYGYLRAGLQQKIYLFQALDDARGWVTMLPRGQEPYDYAAVFVATDLTQPVRGLESFSSPASSGDTHVGQLLPFFLGLPFGALGGYFFRKWQEGRLGQGPLRISPDEVPTPVIPELPSGPMKISGDYAVGGPWYDMESAGDPWLDVPPVVGCPHDDSLDQDDDNDYTIGGPWLDVIGVQEDDRARRLSWPQTRGLIQSAIQEVTDASRMAPAGAYVWSLEPASPEAFSPTARITLEGTTYIESFPSVADALEYMRSRIQTPHVALALFDPRSRHWPNPTNWTKSNDPIYEPVIAQQAAKYAPVRAAGAYVGAIPRAPTIGTALNEVRTRAQSIANKREGRVIGVIHTTKDGLWHALAFSTSDDADDWFGTSTEDPSSYTYAAYYDKDDYLWPHPLNEKIGGARTPARLGRPIRRAPGTIAGAW